MRFTKDLLICILLITTVSLMLVLEVLFIDVYKNNNEFICSDNPQAYWTVEVSEPNDNKNDNQLNNEK